MSIATITFDHLEQDTWKLNNTSSVNPINFDSMTGIYDQASSNLVFTGIYSKNQAGGLLSQDMPLPVYGTKKFQYVAMNVKQLIPAYPTNPISRNELDLKWTLLSGSAGAIANQANVSTQMRPDTGAWQLDPDGKGWVDSGYVPTSIAVGSMNVFQIRAWSDGVAKWSVTGLQCNAETAFIPGADFQNLPLIVTNWSAGLHPQLQWEGILAPFAASVYYARVMIQTSEGPIPMLDPATF